MTANKNLESQSQIYPQFVNAYPVEDEISLIDLWIAILRFKRIFLISFLVLLVLAVIVITVFKSNSYDMTTTLSIGQIEKGDEIKELQSPSAVINRINISLLPKLTMETVEKHEIGIFKTSVSNPKGTNLITIRNKVKDSKQELMAKFQSMITEAILKEHLELSQVLNASMRQELESEKLALQELKNPRELVKLMNFESSSLEDEKNKLVKLTDKEYLEGKKTEFLGRVSLLDSRIKTLNEHNRVLTTRLSSLDDNKANQFQRQQILDKMSSNELGINDSEEKKLNIKRDFDDFKLETRLDAEKVQAMIKTLESEIKLVESNWKAEIKKKESEVLGLQNQLKGNNTRVISNTELSLEPVGLTKELAYVISIFLALFGAFFITLLAMFRAKVNERLAEEV